MSTGAPLDGVVISLIEAPDNYAKKIAEWKSDSTGLHIFENLMHYSHNDPSYLVRVESVPDGYSHGSDEPIYFGHIGLEEKVGYSLYIPDD